MFSDGIEFSGLYWNGPFPNFVECVGRFREVSGMI